MARMYDNGGFLRYNEATSNEWRDKLRVTVINWTPTYVPKLTRTYRQFSYRRNFGTMLKNRSMGPKGISRRQLQTSVLNGRACSLHNTRVDRVAYFLSFRSVQVRLRPGFNLEVFHRHNFRRNDGLVQTDVTVHR